MEPSCSKIIAGRIRFQDLRDPLIEIRMAKRLWVPSHHDVDTSNIRNSPAIKNLAE